MLADENFGEVSSMVYLPYTCLAHHCASRRDCMLRVRYENDPLPGTELQPFADDADKEVPPVPLSTAQANVHPDSQSKLSTVRHQFAVRLAVHEEVDNLRFGHVTM